MTNTGSNIINLQGKRLQHRAAPAAPHRARVISITSGKGGVGKTNIVANLGFALDRLGLRVMILDADLGLGNLDILLGLTPPYNLSHVINGHRHLTEVVVPGPGNLRILPAASGIQELTRLSREQQVCVFSELESLLSTVDVLLVDTAAGISADVMTFNRMAQEVVVVVSPEPTAITDAYALMKILSLRYTTDRFKLLVNSVQDYGEALEVFRQLSVVTDRFLAITLDFMGYVPHDAHVVRSVKRQKLVSELYPDSPAGAGFAALGRRLWAGDAVRPRPDGKALAWDDLLGRREE